MYYLHTCVKPVEPSAVRLFMSFKAGHASLFDDFLAVCTARDPREGLSCGNLTSVFKKDMLKLLLFWADYQGSDSFSRHLASKLLLINTSSPYLQ